MMAGGADEFHRDAGTTAPHEPKVEAVQVIGQHAIAACWSEIHAEELLFLARS